ncbi:MAG: glycyl-radical enzyme activating protein [Lachnospiraceae bacterium]|nr:glycyl-radical enzyme activating protein [Lachnospiraceae bacterium]
MTGSIFHMQRFSLFDGPGVRTVVFFKGCPLRCVWCHNPEGFSAAPQVMYHAARCIGCGDCAAVCKSGAHAFTQGAHMYDRRLCTGCGACASVCCTQALSFVGIQLSVEEVMAEIMKDEPFYRESGGGVTLSGGEPLLQADFAIALLKEIRRQNLTSCVETCGMVDPDKLLQAAQFTDLFYYDYKATGEEMHRRLCGGPQAPVLENLARLEAVRARVVLRCPMVPGANICEEHIRGIAGTAGKYTCICQVQLEPFHRLGLGKAEKLGIDGMYDTEPPERADMEHYCEEITRLCGKKCVIS